MINCLLDIIFGLSQRYCKFKMQKKKRAKSVLPLASNVQLIWYHYQTQKHTPKSYSITKSYQFGHAIILQIFLFLYCLVHAAMTNCLDHINNISDLPTSTPDHYDCNQNCFCLKNENLIFLYLWLTLRNTKTICKRKTKTEDILIQLITYRIPIISDYMLGLGLQKWINHGTHT